jgi:hypothetical protein
MTTKPKKLEIIEKSSMLVDVLELYLVEGECDRLVAYLRQRENGQERD